MTMSNEDLELADQIATNSGDIQDMMLQLTGEVRNLQDKLKEATAYPMLATRTAADTWHKPSDEEERSMVNVLFEFVRAAQYLDKYKAALFYGKPFVPPESIDNHSAHFQFIGDHRRIHAILGIASEAGEIVENMLLEMQNLRHDLPIDQHEHDEKIRNNYGEETGDLDWFQELLAASSGMISVRDARDQNIAKLRKRFPHKFSEADAIARADKADG